METRTRKENMNTVRLTLRCHLLLAEITSVVQIYSRKLLYSLTLVSYEPLVYFFIFTRTIVTVIKLRIIDTASNVTIVFS